MNHGRYYKKLNIKWPRDEVLLSLKDSFFVRGKDKAGIWWPVDESRVNNGPEWVDALSSFTGVQISNMFFSKIHYGGLPIHRDHGRLCALNFPVTGDFTNSKTILVDDFDNLIEEFSGETPYLLNTRQFHGVINETNTDRIVLSVSFYLTYDRICLFKFNNNKIFSIEC